MILVTGASGTVGREVVRLLVEDGRDVAAVTRDPAAASLPAGAAVVAGDPSAPASLVPALDGVEAIFLNPAAVGESAAELLELAASRGVRRAVLLSAVSVEFPAGEERFAERFRVLEEIVRASGLEWTFLRSGDFAGNVRLWAPQIRGTGVVRAPYGDAATSPIHERDLSAVAALALSGAGHAGASYVLTGPASLTQREKLALIGEAIGQALTFAELTPEQAEQGMLGAGVPPEVIARLLGSQADYSERPGPTTDTVAQLLGRPALTFAQWAAEHAAMFRG